MLTSPLTTLQVSASDVGGGAELVAMELHRNLLAHGLDSWMAVGTKVGDDPRVLQIPHDELLSRWKREFLSIAGSVAYEEGTAHGIRWALDRALRFAAEPARILRVQRGLEDFDFPATYRIPDLIPHTPGILHLHNLHGGYFDVRALPTLSRGTPTILTMHDVWLLTGHCAYPLDCDRWRSGCDCCPTLDLPIPIRRDAATENVRVKRAALRRSRLRLATPSSWLMRLVEESGLAECLVEARVIPNGVDEATFLPGDRDAARKAVGLPTDASVVLFAARSAAASPFKGFETLEAAVPAISETAEGVVLLALGTDESSARDGGGVRLVPFVEDRARLALYYQAADVYVHPARAESFGLAVLEAMACGLPVVASRVGGIPEIVVNGGTGLLVPPDDSQALARAVGSLLADPDRRRRFGDAGRERCLASFTLDRQMRSYLGWYEEIAAERPAVCR